MPRGYAPQKPRFDLLEVLATIAAYQDAMWKGQGKRWGRAGSWCIVRQGEIIKFYERFTNRFGRAATMCRRTLSYHIAALKRAGFIHQDTQRHQRHQGGRRAGELDLRPSIYKFTSRGGLWIRRRASWVTNPLELSAVQRIAQSGFNTDLNSLTSLSSPVDKSIHSGRNGKRKNGARRPLPGSPGNGATRRPGKKAPSEERARRATIAQARRNGAG